MRYHRALSPSVRVHRREIPFFFIDPSPRGYVPAASCAAGLLQLNAFVAEAVSADVRAIWSLILPCAGVERPRAQPHPCG